MLIIKAITVRQNTSKRWVDIANSALPSPTGTVVPQANWAKTGLTVIPFVTMLANGKKNSTKEPRPKTTAKI